MLPFFSIVIPLYNKENHIKKTLSHVCAQTFTDFEVIIVNDGSTDESLKAAKSVQDTRIKFFSTENKGVSHARNYGIKQSNSDLIVLLDADDYWLPNHLENLKTLYTKFPNCGLFACGYSKLINNKTVPSRFYKIPDTKHWMGIVANYFTSSSLCEIASSSSVMIHKNTLDNIGGFNTSFSFGEDTDLWIRIALQYPVAFCNVTTVVLQLDSDHRAIHTNPNDRAYLDLDAYNEVSKKRPALKQYMDLHRFAIAIQYKLIKNRALFDFYANAIDFENLKWKQKFFLKLPVTILRFGFYIKRKILNLGINLSRY